MAAKQLGFFLCDYCYTTTWLLQLYLTELKSLPRFLFLLNSLASSPFPASLYSTEALRSCLLDQNGCVCRGREKEGMRGRQTEMLGESEKFFLGGAGAEWRWAVVMSHLLQADRMARESWHVPPSWKQGEDRETSKWGGNYFSIEAHL